MDRANRVIKLKLMVNYDLLADKDIGAIGNTTGQQGGLGPFSGLYGVTDVDQAANNLSSIVSNVISVMTIVAGLWFIFNFFIGAVGIVFAAGNEDALKKGSQKITTSLVGLVIVIASYTLISLIGLILGFDVTDLTVAIKKITP